MQCKICNSTLNSPELIQVKEMMFGSGESFNYFICSVCGCLQIEEPPTDMKKYYPSDYYVHKHKWTFSEKRGIKHKLRGKIAQTPFHILHQYVKNLDIMNLIHFGKLKFEYRVLDVGCGSGDLLYEFYKHGFSDLTGIDPFLGEEYRSSTINLFKMGIEQMTGKFDLVIFNHSFEHIWEQDKTIKKAKELLSEDGMVLIRLPVINLAFEKYRENWVQIDAPRHLFLHTEKSVNVLCGNNGLRIVKILYDSNEFQFVGSEQNAIGILLSAPNSYYENPNISIFSESDVRRFNKDAKKLNREKRGDQASFFIRRIQ